MALEHLQVMGTHGDGTMVMTSVINHTELKILSSLLLLKSQPHLTNLRRISANHSFMLMTWHLSGGRIFIILIMCVCAHEYRSPWRSEDGITSLRAGVIGFCDLTQQGC